MIIVPILLALLSVSLFYYGSNTDKFERGENAFFTGIITGIFAVLFALGLLIQWSSNNVKNDYAEDCKAVGGHVAQDVCVDVNGKFLYNQR